MLTITLSPKSLVIMTVIAVAGMLIVVIYTAIVYRTLHGTIRLEERSY